MMNYQPPSARGTQPLTFTKPVQSVAVAQPYEECKATESKRDDARELPRTSSASSYCSRSSSPGAVRRGRMRPSSDVVSRKSPYSALDRSVSPAFGGAEDGPVVVFSEMSLSSAVPSDPEPVMMTSAPCGISAPRPTFMSPTVARRSSAAVKRATTPPTARCYSPESAVDVVLTLQ